MTTYLISFPSDAMVVGEEDLPLVGAAAAAVIEEAKAAGVYVFAAGVDESVDPVLVDADGTVSTGAHPGSRITGGLTVLEVPDRRAAEQWARRIARACRCAQEVREVR